MRIDVRHNFPQVQQQLREMHKDLREKALALALNKTADKAKTEAIRAVTQEYVITASEIRPRFTLKKASARNFRLTAELEAFGRRRGGRSMNIIHFLERKVTLAEARRRRKSGTLDQLRFKIKRGQAAKVIPGAFLANNGRTVFKRVGKERLPIQGVSIIDLPQMFTSRKIMARIMARVEREYPREVASSIRAVLNRYVK